LVGDSRIREDLIPLSATIPQTGDALYLDRSNATT
jgi:hypothetical protein